jgi:hypothetical protein
MNNYVVDRFGVSYDFLSPNMKQIVLEKCLSFSNSFDLSQNQDNYLGSIVIDDGFRAFWTKTNQDDFIWFWLGSENEYNTSYLFQSAIIPDEKNNVDVPVSLCWISGIKLEFTNIFPEFHGLNIVQESNFIQLGNTEKTLMSYSLNKASITIIIVDEVLTKSEDLKFLSARKYRSAILVKMCGLKDFHEISKFFEESLKIDQETEKGLIFKRISQEVLNLLPPTKTLNFLDVFPINGTPMHNAVEPCSIREIMYFMGAENCKMLIIDAPKKSGKTTALQLIMEKSNLPSKKIDLNEAHEIQIQSDIKLLIVDNYNSERISQETKNLLEQHISDSDNRLVLCGRFHKPIREIIDRPYKKGRISFEAEKIIEMIEKGEKKLNVSIMDNNIKLNIPFETGNNIRMSQLICQNFAYMKILHPEDSSFTDLSQAIEYIIIKNTDFDGPKKTINWLLPRINNDSNVTDDIKRLCRATFQEMLLEEYILVNALISKVLGQNNAELLNEYKIFMLGIENYIEKSVKEKYFQYDIDKDEILVHHDQIEFLLCVKYLLRP